MVLCKPLSAAAQAAFADLVPAAQQFELDRSAADLPGGFTSKTIRGRTYWYYQVKRPDGQPRQIYIGPEGPAARALVDTHRDSPARELGHEHLRRLARAAIALGCAEVSPTHGRIIGRLLDHGFFRAGGILIGTHAFIAYQNHLGLRWDAGTRTQDLDFAHPGRNLSIAMPSGWTVDTSAAIDTLKMGFVPNVAGTTFTKADEPDLQLDFVTSRVAADDRPIRIDDLGLSLQPLKFMEYSMEHTFTGVLLTRTGPLVVQLPDPQRFALHKLIVHGERTRSLRIKAEKDLQQAAALIEWSAEHDPHALAAARDDLLSRGKDWQSRLERGVAALGHRHPGLWTRALAS